MSNETLILILFIIINFLTGALLGALDSRTYWKKKWQKLYDETECSTWNITKE